MSILAMFDGFDATSHGIILFVALLTAITAAGLIGAACFRRDPANRHAVLLVAIIAAPITPLSAWLCVDAGWTLVEIPVATASPRISPDPFQAPRDLSNRSEIATTAERPLPSADAVVVPDREPILDGTAMLGNFSVDAPIASAPALDTVDLAERSSRDESARSTLRRYVAGLALAIWGAGFAFCMARMARGAIVVRNLRRHATPVKRNPAVARVEAALPVRRSLRVLVSERIGTAVAVGPFRPAIVVPRTYLKELSEDELFAVLTHETAHIVRRDHVVGLLQRIVEALFWPHPLVHALNRRLSRAREEVCDNHVLRHCDPRTYSVILLRLVERLPRRCAPASALSFFDHRWKLEDRVAGLLDRRRRGGVGSRRRVPSLTAAAFAVLAVLLGGLRITEDRAGGASAAEPVSDEASPPADEGPAIDGHAERDGSEQHRNPVDDFLAASFFAADGLIVTCSSRSLKSWDAKTGKLVHETSLGAEFVRRSIRLTPDRKRLAVLGREHRPDGSAAPAEIRYFDVTTHASVGKTVLDRDAVDSPVDSMAFTPDGEHVILAGEGPAGAFIEAWRLSTPSRLKGRSLAGRLAGAPAVSPEGRFVAVTVATRDAETAADAEPTAETSTSATETVAESDSPTELLLWDWRGEAEPVAFGSGRRFGDPVFSPDGKTLAVGARNDIQVWDVSERRLVRLLDETSPSERLKLPRAFTLDGEHLLVAHVDASAEDALPSRAVMWNIASGRHVKRFTAPGMSALAVSDDCRFVALRIGDVGFRVWDVETGKIEEHRDGGGETRPAAPHPGPTTALASLASRLEPGAWAELKTEGYTRELVFPDGKEHILSYADSAAWDPVSRQLLFVGGLYSEQVKMIVYREADNSWRTGFPPRDGTFAYDYNTVDSRRGVFYWKSRRDRKSIYRFDIQSEKWSDTPLLPEGMKDLGKFGGMVYFPEMDGLVLVSAGMVHHFSPATQTWRVIRTDLPMGKHQNFAEYDPVRKLVLFGGGNSASDLHRLDADGTVTTLNPAPFELRVQADRKGSTRTIDPVSGEFLVLDADGTLHAYDVRSDSWKRCEKSAAVQREGGIVAAPIPAHGVVMFVNTGSVWLYKHEPQFTLANSDGEDADDKAAQ
ncbi:MAG: M56 family metallopeptidase [Planctomycetaceae bacterium]